MTSSAAERLAPVIEDAVTVDGVRSPYLHARPADADEAVVFVLWPAPLCGRGSTAPVVTVVNGPAGLFSAT
jgi:hypothetical protein